MYIVHVDIRVKPEFLDQFRAATLENASNSIEEAGIERFDFLQSSDDPTRFRLVEVYHAPADQEAHRQTAHYLKWRDTVTDMMAEPRVGVKFGNIYPADEGWS